MKILNLYACLGGNRYKWNDVKSDIEVTAVELDPECARLYQERFPNDKVIIADAHQYLLDNYKEFDFIWSSPPCPSHSKIRHQKACYFNNDVYPVIYPDMSLYQEILLLTKYFKGKFLVENVSPYYTPLIPAKKRGRHLYWCNFNLPNKLTTRKQAKITSGGNEIKNLCEFHDYDFIKYKGTQRRSKIARNLVDYEAGKTIFETVLGIYKQQNTNQTKLF
tara:strand:+ start:166 stop:825 length:660 start_codon:yes stop_codon:yes gene_type:complete